MKKQSKLEEKEDCERLLWNAAEKSFASSPGTSEMKERIPEELLQELQVHQIELEMQNEKLRKAQLALEESRQRYADLYDFAPVGYFTFTPEVLIKDANLTAATLLGVARQKLINRRFRSFVASSDLDLWDQHFLSVLREEEKQTCDLMLKRQDGSTFYAGLVSIRIELSREATEVHTTVTDITAGKRAEEEMRESEEMFKSYLEHAPDGVYLSDLEGNFLYGNRKCEEIIGYRREELIGKNFLELNILSEKSLNKAVQLLQANTDGRATGPDEIDLINKEGRLKPVEINTNVVQRMGQTSSSLLYETSPNASRPRNRCGRARSGTRLFSTVRSILFTLLISKVASSMPTPPL